MNINHIATSHVDTTTSVLFFFQSNITFSQGKTPVAQSVSDAFNVSSSNSGLVGTNRGTTDGHKVCDLQGETGHRTLAKFHGILFSGNDFESV